MVIVATSVVASGVAVAVTKIGTNGPDTMRGTSRADTLVGKGGNDNLRGGPGRDQVGGNVGDDVLYGGSRRDFLYGYAGADVMHGGDGDDVLVAWSFERKRDRLYCGKGNDEYSADKIDYVSSSCEVEAGWVIVD
jgi:Ca2+-binding RTX toxin-like protein